MSDATKHGGIGWVGRGVQRRQVPPVFFYVVFLSMEGKSNVCSVVTPSVSAKRNFTRMFITVLSGF